MALFPGEGRLSAWKDRAQRQRVPVQTCRLLARATMGVAVAQLIVLTRETSRFSRMRCDPLQKLVLSVWHRRHRHRRKIRKATRVVARRTPSRVMLSRGHMSHVPRLRPVLNLRCPLVLRVTRCCSTCGPSCRLAEKREGNWRNWSVTHDTRSCMHAYYICTRARNKPVLTPGCAHNAASSISTERSCIGRPTR